MMEVRFLTVSRGPQGTATVLIEGQTQTIEMGDDVTAQEFGIYVDNLYRSFFVQGFRLRQSLLGLSPLAQCLQLWRLSDRFLSRHMQVIAQESLDYYSAKYSIVVWEDLYQSSKISDNELEMMVFTLQNCFHLCQRLGVPHQEMVVNMALKMPTQLFTKLHDKIDIEFRSVVVKKILKRFEKPSLKRLAPEDALNDIPPAKKRT